MRPKLHAASAALVLASALAIALPNKSARAQWIVYDPANFGQNVLTAAHTLEQINNQIHSLQNEAQMILNQGQMLVNQGKNLASLIYSPMAMLQQDIARTQALIAQAQGLATQVTQLDQQFRQQYPSSYGANTSIDQTVADARALEQLARGPSHDARATGPGQRLDYGRHPDALNDRRVEPGRGGHPAGRAGHEPAAGAAGQADHAVAAASHRPRSCHGPGAVADARSRPAGPGGSRAVPGYGRRLHARLRPGLRAMIAGRSGSAMRVGMRIIVPTSLLAGLLVGSADHQARAETADTLIADPQRLELVQAGCKANMAWTTPDICQAAAGDPDAFPGRRCPVHATHGRPVPDPPGDGGTCAATHRTGAAEAPSGAEAAIEDTGPHASPRQS